MAFEPSSGGSGGYHIYGAGQRVGWVRDNGSQNGGGDTQVTENTNTPSGWASNSYASLQVNITSIIRNYVTNKIILTVDWRLTGYGCYVICWVNKYNHNSGNKTYQYWAGYNQQGYCDYSDTETIEVDWPTRGKASGSFRCHTYHQINTSYEGTYFTFTVPWEIEDAGLEYFIDHNYTGNFTEFIRQRDNTENFAILNKLLYYYKGYTNSLTSSDTENLSSIPDQYSLVKNTYSTQYKNILNTIYNASLASSTGLSVPNGQATGVTTTQFNAARTTVNNIGQLNQYSIVPKLEPYYIVIRTLGYNV